MSDPGAASDSKKGNDAPARIRLAPSRNQKQRSKLKQPNDTPPPSEIPPPAAPPPAAPHIPLEPLRKLRLKRSGQAHEQLLPPAEGDGGRREDEY